VKASGHQQLENDLLEKVRAAEQAYRQAVARTQEVEERYKDLPLGNPDGNVARREVAQAEVAALRQWRMTLRRFSDLVLRGIPPP
jgi:hypothetical protein